MLTKLLLIPHGVSLFNEQKTLQGQLDSPLSERGRNGAKLTASRLSQLPIGAVHSSDLARCAETARILANAIAIEPVLNKDLRGRHYGYLQGLQYSEIEERFPTAYWQLKNRDLNVRFSTCDGQGENIEEFETRTMTAIDLEVNKHRLSSRSNSILAIVTHGGVIDSLLRRASDLASDEVLPKHLRDAYCNFFLFDGVSYKFSDSNWISMG